MNESRLFAIWQSSHQADEQMRRDALLNTAAALLSDENVPVEARWQRFYNDAQRAYHLIPFAQRPFFISDMRRVLIQKRLTEHGAPAEIDAVGLDVLFGPFSEDPAVLRRAEIVYREMRDAFVAILDKQVAPETTWNATTLLNLAASNRHAAVYLLHLYVNEPSLFQPMTPVEALEIAKRLLGEQSPQSHPYYALLREVVAKSYEAATAFSPFALGEPDYDALIKGEKSFAELFPKSGLHIAKEWAAAVLRRHPQRFFEFIDSHQAAIADSDAAVLLGVVREYAEEYPQDLGNFVAKAHPALRMLAAKALEDRAFLSTDERDVAFALAFAEEKSAELWRDAIQGADYKAKRKATEALARLIEHAEDESLAQRFFKLWRDAVLPSELSPVRSLLKVRNACQTVEVMQAFADPETESSVKAGFNAVIKYIEQQYRDYLLGRTGAERLLEWKEMGLLEQTDVASRMKTVEEELAQRSPRTLERKKNALERAFNKATHTSQVALRLS